MGATSGEITVTNLKLDSLQGDKIILDLLKQMGANIVFIKDTVKVKKARLQAIQADLSDCIDLLPTLAVLAAIAEGKSTFTGVRRARLKESNRIRSLRKCLEKMAIPVQEDENTLTIVGTTPKSATIDPEYDHRIAMAFSILGVITGNTVIDNAECVNKTFPEFWGILKNIGGKLSTDV